VLDAQGAACFRVVATELERALKESRRAFERQPRNRAVAAPHGRKRRAVALSGTLVAGREQLRIAVVARLERTRERGVERGAAWLVQHGADALAHAIVVTFDAPHSVVARAAAHELLGAQNVERGIAGGRASGIDRDGGGEGLPREREHLEQRTRAFRELRDVTFERSLQRDAIERRGSPPPREARQLPHEERAALRFADHARGELLAVVRVPETALRESPRGAFRQRSHAQRADVERRIVARDVQDRSQHRLRAAGFIAVAEDQKAGQSVALSEEVAEQRGGVAVEPLKVVDVEHQRTAATDRPEQLP
jgi:hypothetical protein